MKGRRRRATAALQQIHTVDEYVAWLLKARIRLLVDAADGCNLRCVDCPSGARPREPIMFPPNVLARAIVKLDRENPTRAGRCVCLFNWGEPFLNPGLADLVRVVARRGHRPAISTNFSLTDTDIDIEAVLAAGLSRLIVSVSGWDQQTHKRYHRGSNIENVRANLLTAISAIKARGLDTRVTVRFLKFTYNTDEVAPWERLCKRHGIRLDACVAVALEATTGESSENLIGFKSLDPRPPRVRDYVHCAHRSDLVLAADGTVYLCCKYWSHPGLALGNFFELTLVELLRRAAVHEACRVCVWRQDRAAGALPLPESITREARDE